MPTYEEVRKAVFHADENPDELAKIIYALLKQVVFPVVQQEDKDNDLT